MGHFVPCVWGWGVGAGGYGGIVGGDVTVGGYVCRDKVRVGEPWVCGCGGKAVVRYCVSGFDVFLCFECWREWDV